MPGYRFEENLRSVTVVATGLSPSGKEVRIKAKNDLLAQALEHEIDHINGIVYIDRLPSLDMLEKIEPEEAPSH